MEVLLITVVMGSLSYYAGITIRKNKRRAIIMLALVVLIYGIYLYIL